MDNTQQQQKSNFVIYHEQFIMDNDGGSNMVSGDAMDTQI